MVFRLLRRYAMRKMAIVSAILVLFLAAPTCFAAAPMKIFVSILPQKYFVERIGGDLLDVSVMVRPGASPATYEPKPRQMAEITRTRIYFAIGVPFEKVWLEKIAATNPKMRIVHTEAGIEKIPMLAHHHHEEKSEHRHDEDEHYHQRKRHGNKEAEHHHDEKEKHQDTEAEDDHLHHGIKDPHVWLSPPLVMVQARNILRALDSVDPVNRSAYERNYRDFIMELVVLDEELRKIFAGKKEGLEFLVFHPAWGYFANSYGLEQVPIEIEGKEPKPAELKDLIEHARERDIKVIFVQPQFSSESAKTIAKSIGGQVAVVDPLAADWSDNLREVARKFRAALK
jgi:zinc transport system substrate-binding protein